jgi:hypothetical protein
MTDLDTLRAEQPETYAWAVETYLAVTGYYKTRTPEADGWDEEDVRVLLFIATTLQPKDKP